jgi:hypothetical protein
VHYDSARKTRVKALLVVRRAREKRYFFLWLHAASGGRPTLLAR